MKPSPWMHSEADGAYSGKISFYAPMVWLRRGLFRQNLFLSPDGSISTGLIPAKSLSKPRWSGIVRAYFDKISFYAPMVRYRRGVFRQNLFLSPDGLASAGLILTKSLSTPRGSVVAGAYFGKIPFYAPRVRYHRGVFRQNFYLSPEGSISTGRNNYKL